MSLEIDARKRFPLPQIGKTTAIQTEEILLDRMRKVRKERLLLRRHQFQFQKIIQEAKPTAIRKPSNDKLPKKSSRSQSNRSKLAQYSLIERSYSIGPEDSVIPGSVIRRAAKSERQTSKIMETSADGKTVHLDRESISCDYQTLLDKLLKDRFHKPGFSHNLRSQISSDRSKLNKTLPDKLILDHVLPVPRTNLPKRLPSLISGGKWAETGLSYNLNSTLAQAIGFRLVGQKIEEKLPSYKTKKGNISIKDEMEKFKKSLTDAQNISQGVSKATIIPGVPPKGRKVAGALSKKDQIGAASKSTLGVGSSSLLLALDSSEPMSNRNMLDQDNPSRPTLTPGQLADLIPRLLGTDEDQEHAEYDPDDQDCDEPQRNPKHNSPQNLKPLNSHNSRPPHDTFAQIQRYFDEVSILVNMSFEELFFLNNFSEVLQVLAVAAKGVHHLRFDLGEEFNLPERLSTNHAAQFLYREVYKVAGQEQDIVVKERQSCFLRKILVFYLKSLETFVANPQLNYNELVTQFCELVSGAIAVHEEVCMFVILGLGEFWQKSYEFGYLIDAKDSSQLTLLYLQLVKRYLKTTLAFLEGDSTTFYDKLSQDVFVLSDTFHLLLVPYRVSSYYQYPQVCQAWKEVHKLLSQFVSITPGLVRAPIEVKFLALDVFASHILLACRPALTGVALPTQDCLMFMLDLVLHQTDQDMEQLDISNYGRMLIYLKKCIELDGVTLDDHFQDLPYLDLPELEREQAHAVHCREAANIPFKFCLDLDMLKHRLVTRQKYCRVALDKKSTVSQGPMAFVFLLIDVLTLYFSIRVERGVPHNLPGLDDLEPHLDRFKKQIVKSPHYLKFPDIAQKLTIKLSALSLLFKIGIA